MRIADRYVARIIPTRCSAHTSGESRTLLSLPPQLRDYVKALPKVINERLRREHCDSKRGYCHGLAIFNGWRCRKVRLWPTVGGQISQRWELGR